MLEECVYFILAKDINRIKIGRTNDPDRRFAQLATASPHRLTMLYLAAGDAELEAECHRIWHHLQVAGEWFEAAPDLITFAHDLAARQPFMQRALTGREVEVRQINAVMKAWNKAGRGAREEFLRLIGDRSA